MKSLQTVLPANSNLKSVPIGWIDVWALGITIVIGGQYFAWNEGLEAGFGSFFIGTLLIGMAYYCLCSCTSELSSVVPFAGGSYGLARCTFGNYLGFLVGCCEALEYILYVTVATVALGDLITTLHPSFKHWDPVIWLVFFLTSLIIHGLGGRVFWNFSFCIAVFSFIIVLIFCLGSLPWVDMKAHVGGDRSAVKGDINTFAVGWFIDGFPQFMKSFPLAAWFFVGVESLNMVCDDTDKPKNIIPRGQQACMITLLCTAVFILLVNVSLEGYEDTFLAEEMLPLNRGFVKMFNISPTHAILLSIPATYATGFGFMYSYGKLMVAMADSRLIPVIISRRSSANRAPLLALIAGSVASYAICLLVFFIPFIKKYLFNLCMLFAFLTYISQCLGFLHLRVKFKDLHREFTSPVGVPGALFAVAVWVMGLVSVLAFQQDQQLALVAFCCVISTASLYYFLFARHRQILSANENEILYFAHWLHLSTYDSKRLALSAQQGMQSTSDVFTLLSIDTTSRKGDSQAEPVSRLHPDIMSAVMKNPRLSQYITSLNNAAAEKIQVIGVPTKGISKASVVPIDLHNNSVASMFLMIHPPSEHEPIPAECPRLEDNRSEILSSGRSGGENDDFYDEELGSRIKHTGRTSIASLPALKSSTEKMSTKIQDDDDEDEDEDGDEDSGVSVEDSINHTDRNTPRESLV